MLIAEAGVNGLRRLMGTEARTLGAQEAAAYLRLHPVTLLNRARAGEVRGAKIGRAWVFLEVDLMEYISSVRHV